MLLAQELIEEIRKKAEIISREFNLNFQDYQLDYVLISVEEYLLIYYMLNGSRQEPLQQSYSLSTYDEKAANLSKYVKTESYSRELTAVTIGAMVMRKSKAEKGLAACKNIDEENLRNKMEDLYKKMITGYNSHRIIVISYKENIDLSLITRTFLHEVMHWVLFDEKINFSNINSEYGIYDEGLAEYLTYYALNDLNSLEEEIPRTKTMKAYVENALKFNELLKGAKSPVERKKKILNFLEYLKTNSTLQAQ